MNSNIIMDYMRKQLSQICNEKNNRNRQELVTVTLQMLENQLFQLEDVSYLRGQENIQESLNY